MYAIVIALILGVVSFAGYTVFTMFTPSFTPIKTDTESSTNATPSSTAVAETHVHLTRPHPQERITNPLTVSGEAKGTWFGEGVFPVVLYDGNMQEVARGIAAAQGEWMTENFVPFTLTLYFTKPATPLGTLRLYRDNASGLPQNDAWLDTEIKF